MKPKGGEAMTDDLILRENIKNNLIALRESRGLMQSEVGEIVGKSRTAVASWEQGLSLPHLTELYKLSKLYDKSLEYFFENPEDHLI
jgi:transcriptional regulator with XRE-family HTH domain